MIKYTFEKEKKDLKIFLTYYLSYYYEARFIINILMVAGGGFEPPTFGL